MFGRKKLEERNKELYKMWKDQHETYKETLRKLTRCTTKSAALETELGNCTDMWKAVGEFLRKNFPNRVPEGTLIVDKVMELLSEQIPTGKVRRTTHEPKNKNS